MSYTSANFESAPIPATSLPPVQPTVAEPAPKRKPGRPCKGESSKGKAPMASPAPKRARGRPRKEPSTSQLESSSHLVSYDQFYAAHMEHHHRFLIQATHFDTLWKELLMAKDVISRQGELINSLIDKARNSEECTRLQQEMIQDMHNWNMSDVRRIERTEGTLKNVVDYLVEHTDFPPPAPPA